ncbi:MAG: response regulator transcription factor [Bacteroidia bacterium]|nr:response regulator transcription factor [Bacteroidia bacterium]
MIPILLVEDETNFGTVLRDYLHMNGYEVTLCMDGEAGFQTFRTQPFRLCILDVMMPRMDGFTLARKIREINSDIPIIFLTARSMREDVHKGFEIGGDDYITKPFDSEELLYRVKAVLKRTESANTASKDEDTEVFSFGQFLFNYRLHTISHRDENIRLSPKEADLLRLLLQRQNDLLSREEALNALWGDDNYFNARSMDVFISKLRKRFKDDPSIRIENVHGKGFRLVIEPV